MADLLQNPREADRRFAVGSDHANRRPRKIRYSNAEWDSILERAHACGRPPARYVREVSLGVVPKASRAHVTGRLVHELGRLGTRLTTIAERERSAGNAATADSIDEGLRELLALVRRLA
jgi:hypothetical protein